MRCTGLIVAGLAFWVCACAENNKNADMQGNQEPMARTDEPYLPPDSGSDPGMQPGNLYTTEVTPPPRYPAGTTAGGAPAGNTGGSTAYIPVETAGGEELSPSTGSRRPAARSSSEAPKSRTRYYTVRKGDTLSEISEKLYGDSTKWRRIYNANRSKIKDPKKLQIGTRLTIP